MYCTNNFDRKTANIRVFLFFVMPLTLLTATTLGFVIPASATSPGSALHNKQHLYNRQGFNSPLNKKTGLPSASAKIRTPPIASTTTDTQTVDNSIASKKKILYGEHQSNIFSRLLYFYASQLLDISSQRQIEISDSLPVPDHILMDEQVPELERIYKKCKSKAHTHLERLKSSSSMSPTTTTTSRTRRRILGGKQTHHGDTNILKQKLNEKIAKSESLILAKAIILHQRKNLATTGTLRLVNTLIQAFPSILVARLLRFIESGDAVHPSKPIIAAFQLVLLLSVKMLIENQYFHNVIKCSTMVRGSLMGLLFDKSLRLSSNAGTGSSSSSNEVAGLSTSKSNSNGEKNNGKKDEIQENEKGKQKEKSLSLGTGGILNLMQSDVSILEGTALQIHTIWDGLLQITIFSTLLFKYLGPSVLWGIAVLFLTIPTNSVTLRVLNRLSKYESEAKDARTKKTSEAISNMKLLKLQGWENVFKEGIESQRAKELRRHVNKGAFRALNNAISNAIPSIVLVVSLTAYRRTGKPIVASTIFTAISLFNQLRFPLLFYPMVVDSLANGKNALRRLSKYLCEEELTPYVQNIPMKSNEEGGYIQLMNGNFLWRSPMASAATDISSQTAAAPALCGAELSINPGEIVAVVGSVGSGKTALVKALLGELEPAPRIMVDESAGASMSSWSNYTSVNDIPIVKSRGDVAYCAQESWLSKGSILEAVLFGRELDEQRYLDALYDSGLDEDFNRGSLTHETQVGEGGSSLSGGQRARVQLARALYGEDVGVYLLDDPLSALDASVGSIVFERVTKRIKQRKAAAIFVTNDVSLPRRCDRVILMGSAGSQSCSQIIDTGTYRELLSRGHDFRNIEIHDVDDSNDQSESTISKTGSNDNEIRINTTGIFVDEAVTQHADIDCQLLMEHDVDGLTERRIPNLSSKSRFQGGNCTLENSREIAVTMDDNMSTGAVPRKTYTSYLKSIRSPLLIVMTLACFLTANGAQFFQQYTVAKWTELSHEATSMSAALGGKYLQTLVHSAGVVSLFLWLRSYILMRSGVRASDYLHNKMLSSVFGAPVTFFDSTPSGQVMSRFGKELETVDRGVPDGIGSVLFCFLQIFITAAGLAGVVSPRIIFPVVGIGIFYNIFMAKFRPAARDLKRCESKSRSPIYTHFGETLRGVEIIRSFSYSPFLWSSRFRYLIDENLAVFNSVKSLDRWLSIRLETLGNMVVLIAAFASVYLTRSGQLKAGSAGWGLTQSLAITGLLTWAVRVLTDLESQMMSVMRVRELFNFKPSESAVGAKMPQEFNAPGEALGALYLENEKILLPSAPSTDNALIQSGWPWKGEISFNNVSMRYNPTSPLVLKNVTIKIPPGTTLGIVGRTGSGKSSLLLTLFRLIEIEKGGEINIDGVDIRSISLQSLRESLAIIPQDPTLFSGTLQYNLDATGKSKPEDAWAALEAASPDLANEFCRSGNGLDTIIEEGGKNYSLGQRQLICLARALLRRSKILVLDEATSSVDPNTDEQVQDTIRREFVEKGVSVITVAHRLDTVLGSDKIAVLGDGELIEYGNPTSLLQNPTGHLRKLVDADAENKRKAVKASAVKKDSMSDRVLI